jgi:hypothetical protein
MSTVAVEKLDTVAKVSVLKPAAAAAAGCELDEGVVGVAGVVEVDVVEVDVVEVDDVGCAHKLRLS